MSTWEERMAVRAAERRIVAEADEVLRDADEQARLAVEFPPVEGEDDEVRTDPGHYGHRWHGTPQLPMYPQHPNYRMCSCGETGGVWSVAVDPDYRAPTEPCPVCVARGIA